MPVIEMRSRCPIAFGDEASRAHYEAGVRRERERMLQRGVRFAVAPGIAVKLPDGRMVQALSEVTIEQVGGIGRMRELVAAGKVLEADIGGDDPEAA